MEDKSALVTGAASGIGRAVALRLAQAGYSLTLLDMDMRGLEQTAASLLSLQPSAAVHIQTLDVTNSEAQHAAFLGHVQRYGHMNVAILNAGIAERGDFLDPSTPQHASQGGWQATLDVDLTAVMTGMRSAVACMAGSGHGGGKVDAAGALAGRCTIVTVASASAFFPMPAAPVYAASKAGVVHLTRSLAGKLAKRGITAVSVCPEFVDTPLVRNVADSNPIAARALLGSPVDQVSFLKPEQIANEIFKLLQPGTKAGRVLLIRQDGRVQEPYAKLLYNGPAGTPQPRGSGGMQHEERQRQAYAAWATRDWPQTYRKVQVHRLSNKFREATSIINAPLLPQGTAPPPGMLLLRRVAVGINASDVNYTSGRYHSSMEDAQAKLPFDAGFETVSVVAAVGPGVKGFVKGDAVASLTYDGFAEWAITPAKLALKVPRATADMVPLLTSGLTASIALSEEGRLKAGETVLVTAAAGGTGQFAVQLAKLAGCHVVATCGSSEKAAMLKRLGADRTVDYKSEQLKDVLRKEYPRGVDVVYEGVGGDMFKAALNGLAERGRLIIIGMMGAYSEGWPLSTHPGMCEKLLWKSAAVVGFFLLRYAPHFRSHLDKLVGLLDTGKLQVEIDPRRFVGIESVPEAVEWLHSGQSVGKVVVQLCREVPQSAEAAAKL